MRHRAISRPSATLLVAVALGLGVAAAHAGPCTSRIAQFEQAVRQSAGNPNAGPMAPQSIGAQLGYVNRRLPRSNALSRRRKRRSPPHWHAPSGWINKEIELGVRGHSPPPGGCTICSDPASQQLLSRGRLRRSPNDQARICCAPSWLGALAERGVFADTRMRARWPRITKSMRLPISTHCQTLTHEINITSQRIYGACVSSRQA